MRDTNAFCYISTTNNHKNSGNGCFHRLTSYQQYGSNIRLFLTSLNIHFASSIFCAFHSFFLSLSLSLCDWLDYITVNMKMKFTSNITTNNNRTVCIQKPFHTHHTQAVTITQSHHKQISTTKHIWTNKYQTKYIFFVWRNPSATNYVATRILFRHWL